VIDYNLSNKDYHFTSAISKSGLDQININPATYKYLKTHKRVITPTLQKTFDIGSLTHSLVLEKTDKGFIKAPDINKNTKAYKEFKANNSGLTVLGSADYDMCKDMADAVNKHTLAGPLFTQGKPEVSVFAEDMKCRPDYLRDDGWIIDLKTVSSLLEFEKSVQNHRYYVQHYFYIKVCELAGIDVAGFKFVAVSKSKPHQVAVYELTPEDIEQGRM